jgi:enoyl-CoA hydratase/carnithine racemase
LLWPIGGEATVRRLSLLSDMIDGVEAHRLGLVHELVDATELDQRIAEIGERLVKWDPTPLSLTKRSWRDWTEASFRAAVESARIVHAANFEAGSLSHGATEFVRASSR